MFLAFIFQMGQHSHFSQRNIATISLIFHLTRQHFVLSSALIILAILVARWRMVGGLAFYWCPPATGVGAGRGLHCKFFQPNMQRAFGSRTISRKGWSPGYRGTGQPQTLPILTEPDFFFFLLLKCYPLCAGIVHPYVLSLHCDAMRCESIFNKINPEM